MPCRSCLVTPSRLGEVQSEGLHQKLARPLLLADFLPWGPCRGWRKEGLYPEGSLRAGCIIPPQTSAPITAFPHSLVLGSPTWKMLPPPSPAGLEVAAEALRLALALTLCFLPFISIPGATLSTCYPQYLVECAPCLSWTLGRPRPITSNIHFQVVLL